MLLLSSSNVTDREVTYFPNRNGYLSHVAIDLARIQVVKKWRTPPCTQEVKSFFGFVGYYQQFRHSFATIARLLNILSSSKVRFQRRKAERTEFQQLKRLLIEHRYSSILTQPDATYWILALAMRLLPPFCNRWWTEKSGWWPEKSGWWPITTRNSALSSGTTI